MRPSKRPKPWALETEPNERSEKNRLEGTKPIARYPSLGRDSRLHARKNLKIPAKLLLNGKECLAQCMDMSLSGLRLFTMVHLQPGTPLSLECSFSQTCYLKFSGQVVFCLGAKEGVERHFVMGIKFAGNHSLEQHILQSCIDQMTESPREQEKSLFTILVAKDSLAVEASQLTKDQSFSSSPSPCELNAPIYQKQKIKREQLIPKLKKIDYSSEAAKARLDWLSERTGTKLQYVSMFADAPESLRGNVENFIGAVQIPIGLAGPLLINGSYASGTFYIPMATTEGALTYTYAQAMLLISQAGGAHAALLRDETHITPLFCFKSVAEARKFVRWLSEHFEDIRYRAESTTRHGKLLSAEPHVLDRNVAVKFRYTTGDAMGMNMITFATEAACKYIVKANKPDRYYLQSNFSSLKKVALHNYIMGFGKTVVCDVSIPPDLLKRFYHVTPAELLEYYRSVVLTTKHAGMIGVSGHTANAIAAVFMACGQDVASVVDSYVCVTNFDMTPDGSLYASVNLPCLLVGTVGGGTSLMTQTECLAMIGCHGPGHANKFAEIIAATVLAGELGICARVANGTFADGHRRYGRRTWLNATPLQKSKS